MKDLMNTLETQTMSSKEIGELCESRHDKVKQSIKRLATRGVINLPPMGKIGTGREKTTVYIFNQENKRDSYIVVAQLSPEFTGRLVDRWQELEAAAAPKTEAEMLVIHAQRLVAQERAQAQAARLLAETEKRVELLEVKTNSEEDYFTVKAHASVNGIKIDARTAARIGRIASKKSRENSVMVGRVKDSRYGEVNSYHIDMLDEAFDIFYGDF